MFVMWTVWWSLLKQASKQASGVLHCHACLVHVVKADRSYWVLVLLRILLSTGWHEACAAAG